MTTAPTTGAAPEMKDLCKLSAEKRNGVLAAMVHSMRLDEHNDFYEQRYEDQRQKEAGVVARELRGDHTARREARKNAFFAIGTAVGGAGGRVWRGLTGPAKAAPWSSWEGMDWGLGALSAVGLARAGWLWGAAKGEKLRQQEDSLLKTLTPEAFKQAYDAFNEPKEKRAFIARAREQLANPKFYKPENRGGLYEAIRGKEDEMLRFEAAQAMGAKMKDSTDTAVSQYLNQAQERSVAGLGEVEKQRELQKQHEKKVFWMKARRAAALGALGFILPRTARYGVEVLRDWWTAPPPAAAGSGKGSGGLGLRGFPPGVMRPPVEFAGFRGGSHIWGGVENIYEKGLGKDPSLFKWGLLFDKLPRGGKDILIDAVKDRFAADPAKYGVPLDLSGKPVDIDHLTQDQLKGLDWRAAFTDALHDEKKITGQLTGSRMASAEENRRLLEEWARTHKGQTLESTPGEKNYVDDVLKDMRGSKSSGAAGTAPDFGTGTGSKSEVRLQYDAAQHGRQPKPFDLGEGTAGDIDTSPASPDLKQYGSMKQINEFAGMLAESRTVQGADVLRADYGKLIPDGSIATQDITTLENKFFAMQKAIDRIQESIENSSSPDARQQLDNLRIMEDKLFEAMRELEQMRQAAEGMAVPPGGRLIDIRTNEKDVLFAFDSKGNITGVRVEDHGKVLEGAARDQALRDALAQERLCNPNANISEAQRSAIRESIQNSLKGGAPEILQKNVEAFKPVIEGSVHKAVDSMTPQQLDDLRKHFVELAQHVQGQGGAREAFANALNVEEGKIQAMLSGILDAFDSNEAKQNFAGAIEKFMIQHPDQAAFLTDMASLDQIAALSENRALPQGLQELMELLKERLTRPST